MADPKNPFNPAGIRTVSITERPSKVNERAFAGKIFQGMTFGEWFDSLPQILAAKDVRDIARAIADARENNCPVILGMGGHVIKVGLSPLIIGMMERGVITGLAMNGSCIIHDFEIAFAGNTSEDVAEVLDTGMFGMTRETGDWLNRVISRCGAEDVGLGRAVGEAILGSEAAYKDMSLLAQAARLEAPVTVHVSMGSDIIHMHPAADGAAIGKGSLRDFLIFTSMVSDLEGGVYINLGSAVVLPEVFLKAISLSRNKTSGPLTFTTVNMDFIQHYRPNVNVVGRPTRTGGKGYRLTGHHEIMFPLLMMAVAEERERRRQG